MSITDEHGNAIDQSAFAQIAGTGGLVVFGNGVDAQGGYRASVGTKDGHTYSVHMAGDSAKSFAKNFSDTMTRTNSTAKSDSFTSTDSRSKEVSDVVSKANTMASEYSTAATRTQELKTSVSEANSNTTAMGVRLESVAVMGYADKYHGGHGPEEVKSSMIEMKEMENNAPGQLQERIHGILEEKGYMAHSDSQISAHLNGAEGASPSNVNTQQGNIEQNIMSGAARAVYSQPNHDGTAQKISGASIGDVSGGQLYGQTQFDKDTTTVNNAGESLSATPAGAMTDRFLGGMETLATGDTGVISEAPTAQGAVNGHQYSGVGSERRLVDNTAAFIKEGFPVITGDVDPGLAEQVAHSQGTTTKMAAAMEKLNK
jgi:hypothetical protein